MLHAVVIEIARLRFYCRMSWYFGLQPHNMCNAWTVVGV